MQTIEERMKRVGEIAEIVGLAELAREAGMPRTTVRSYHDRDWRLASLANCEKLIAAADRLSRGLSRTSRA